MGAKFALALGHAAMHAERLFVCDEDAKASIHCLTAPILMHLYFHVLKLVTHAVKLNGLLVPEQTIVGNRAPCLSFCRWSHKCKAGKG